MMKSNKLLLVIAITLSFVFCSTAFCGEIKERMKQRLPQIVDLKNKGIVGETNTGYLGFVTAKKEKQDVVASENQDRKTIYTQIAKKENVSIQFVAKKRAVFLFSNSTQGHYYQNEAGAWVKK